MIYEEENPRFVAEGLGESAATFEMTHCGDSATENRRLQVGIATARINAESAKVAL